jgi:hypothetical protein
MVRAPAAGTGGIRSRREAFGGAGGTADPVRAGAPAWEGRPRARRSPAGSSHSSSRARKPGGPTSRPPSAVLAARDG